MLVCSVANAADIVDADTLKLETTTYRLWGIDAPEAKQICERGGAPYPCGEQATLALIEMIGGRPVHCEPMAIDRYGRVIGKCYVDDVDLGGWLVENGHALDYMRYSDGFYQRQQRAAEASRRGLWSGEFKPPWAWRRNRR